MTKGDRIKELREAAGLTQEDLAKKMNTTKQTIFKYEKGIVTNIPSDRIEELAALLNSTPEYILGWKKATSEDMKKNDVKVDVVNRLYNDDAFFNLVEKLNALTPAQFERIVKLLNLFIEETKNEIQE